jgi:hypothetical protein
VAESVLRQALRSVLTGREPPARRLWHAATRQPKIALCGLWSLWTTTSRDKVTCLDCISLLQEADDGG